MTIIKALEKNLNIPIDINEEEVEKIKKESLEEIYKQTGLKKKSSKDAS